MNTPAPIAAVTGASGYLGSRICTSLQSRGWQVVRLARVPSSRRFPAVAYELAGPISPEVKEVLRSADVLVHGAYDLSLTSRVDIWRVNVEGTRRLLEVAADARMRRVLVLSSMSAFDGTTQLYGRAKLAIESLTVASGACAVRPGLVYGERPGGMAGALRKLTKLPIVPVIAGGTGLYTVHEDDLMRAIGALAGFETLQPQTISVAHPIPIALPDMMRVFAAQEDRRCRLVPVPWQSVYYPLRFTEVLRAHLPFRADSVLGLVRTAPCVGNDGPLTQLGVTPRAFHVDASDRA